MTTVIGVDLGATKVLAAAVTPDGRATDHRKATTPTDGPDAVVATIEELVRRIDPAPAAVGVGAPGPVHDGLLASAPNLRGFGTDTDLAGPLADTLGCLVVLGNDGNLGTLGEARHGAGRGAPNALGCFLGTGIGGGLVLDDRLVTGAFGAAGELGHVPVQLDGGPLCGCGRHGCLEAFAGRDALERAARAAIDRGASDRLEQIRAAKGKTKLTSAVWKAALKEADPLATELMDRAVAALAAALAGVINLVDVDTIIFGGGLTEKLGTAHVQRIAAATEPRLITADLPRRWVPAALGDDAGAIGAAELARDALA